MPLMEVGLDTKPGCCLCDEVKAQLQALRQQHAFEYREVNILEDRQAFKQFQEEIPVVFMGGKKAFKYHLDENVFLKRLARGAKHDA